jgi:hypothetical protein
MRTVTLSERTALQLLFDARELRSSYRHLTWMGEAQRLDRMYELDSRIRELEVAVGYTTEPFPREPGFHHRALVRLSDTSVAAST